MDDCYKIKLTIYDCYSSCRNISNNIRNNMTIYDCYSSRRNISPLELTRVHVYNERACFL